MHVVYGIDHLGSGGAQRQAVELAAELSSRDGVRVSVLTYWGHDFFASRLEEAGVPWVRIEKWTRIDPSLPWRVARWLGRERPDVLHAFLPTPALWYLAATRFRPRGSRPRFFFGERNTRIDEIPVESTVQRIVCRRADRVTANSHLAARLIRERLGVPEDRVVYVPNGIDLARWDERAARPSPIEFDPDSFHLAIVGRLDEAKNHLLLLAALERIEPSRRAALCVWCIGAETGAGTEQRIRGEAQRIGLADCLRFHPATPELAAVLARLDALVLCSSREGFPNVILEAMASRKPCVATDVGDVSELVEDGVTGFVTKPGDAAALARALERLLALPPAERRAMGERGRAAVERRYRLASVADRYLELYRGMPAES